MKKVLFATTALIATAGIASAEVALSGSAQMGIIGGDISTSGSDEIQFFTDIDVTFTLSGTTEGGLTYGASIDLDESDGDPSQAFSGSTQGGETIFVTGTYGTLTMGDTDGAFDFAMQEAAIGSSIGDVHTEHAGYEGNSGLDGFSDSDGQVARYNYTFGDFTVAASFEIGDDGANLETDGDFDDSPIYGLGGNYVGDFGTFTLGLGAGYQQAGDSSVIGVSADVNASGFRAIVNYSDFDDVADRDYAYGIALGYEFQEYTVAMNYGVKEFDDGDAEGYGVVVNYDLGGAELQLGYGDGEDQDGNDADGYSFGLSMAF